MAEFVAASDVRPEWMPIWIHEQHVDSLNEERDHHEEVFLKLEDNGTFQKLETAGGLPLCPEARGQLATALAFARCFPLGVGSRQRQPKREKLAKKAEALAAEIEAELTVVDYLFELPAIELPHRLRQYAQRLDRTIGDETLFQLPGPELNELLISMRAQTRERRPLGRHSRDQDDWVIEVAAELLPPHWRSCCCFEQWTLRKGSKGHLGGTSEVAALVRTIFPLR
jgi:hypothetical protein